MKPLTIILLCLLCISARPHSNNRPEAPEVLLAMEFRWHQMHKWITQKPRNSGVAAEITYVADKAVVYWVGTTVYALWDIGKREVAFEWGMK